MIELLTSQIQKTGFLNFSPQVDPFQQQYSTGINCEPFSFCLQTLEVFRNPLSYLTYRIPETKYPIFYRLGTIINKYFSIIKEILICLNLTVTR